MHDTALLNAGRFFDTYTKRLTAPVIVDLGSLDVNGSLKSVAPTSCKYIGVDCIPGKGVDVILEDPYKLPFADNSTDVVACSSVFEHSEFFWVLFLEILRILKPTGLLYLNVPSNGEFHRYPVDCWRFYPDSGVALSRWAQRNGFPAILLESYISDQKNDQWNDYVGVFLKDQAHAKNYPDRITKTFTGYTNGLSHPELEKHTHLAVHQEDQRGHLAKKLRKKISNRLGR